MKAVVISYSLTGNNEALAKRIASGLKAEHIRVKENKRRTTGTILIDMFFGRTPDVKPAPAAMSGYGAIVFVGPVWMGQAASPLRIYFDALKKDAAKYAYVSISGGALNPNPKLAAGLRKRTGILPAAVIDQHIADFLPKEPKPTTKDTGAYRITGTEVEKLANKAISILMDKLCDG